MKRMEYIERLREIASLACTMRSKLGELQEDVRKEWELAEMCSEDEMVWREYLLESEEFYDDVDMLEVQLNDIIENTEE